MRLGLRTLRNLTHTLGPAAPTRSTALPTVTAVEALQARALRIAQLASSVARLPEDAASAYIVEGEQPAPELLSRFGAEDLYATQRRQFQKGEA